MTFSTSNVSFKAPCTNINNSRSRTYIPRASKLLKFFLMFPMADFISNIGPANEGFDSRAVCIIENSSEIPHFESVNCTALSTILNTQDSDAFEVESDSNVDFVKKMQKSMESFVPSFLIYTAINQVLKKLKGN